MYITFTRPPNFKPITMTEEFSGNRKAKQPAYCLELDLRIN